MRTFITCLILAAASLLPADSVNHRFAAPSGYKKIVSAPGSFGAYLQTLALKPAGTHTLTYKGAIARTDPYTAAVIDMSVGTQDLQQCADAVIRLRAEYLYERKDYQNISFNFTSGFKCDFVHYANGYRYVKEKWVLKGKKDYSRENFMRYLSLVFSYAGTISLQKELNAVTNANDIQAGDVFIKGGSPGHCFIVLQVAENASHQKKFLLAQSFMPAQNIQVLQNGSPWFTLHEIVEVPYGELIKATNLKRF
ncbi:hypothetical protein D0C36_10945 [Mucilaginibacter conchicola]|uniref:DUF4846 domain-containing protein n=1 Tax=Mucilaginibacter conchicola TaxID=2303333 RepID=A0A372NTP1_9SPHI|nr:DUF4846 domain-containing protein [Mucilaginibacter conchicola]RFZ91957.1 hypothetical protein D0C36_10945 [Mucilaginibacter conchicola]